jgi:integrase
MLWLQQLHRGLCGPRWRQDWLYLGFAAGLRVSELVGLRLDDIELDGPYPSILVRGKETNRAPLEVAGFQLFLTGRF